MLTLNLIDKDASGIKYELLTFSDSQPHIKIAKGQTIESNVIIITRLSSANDLLLLLFATEVLRSLQPVNKRILVFITYLLCARMDRAMNEGEPYSLRVIADIINSQHYFEVHVLDPHSDKASSLIYNLKVADQSLFLSRILLDKHIDVLISPDKGAKLKTEALGAAQNRSVVYCTKSRDVNTGHLSNVSVGEGDLQGKDVLIVDDICDGGRTFVNLLQPLKDRGAKTVSLAVTHGIFSQGLDPLAGFDNVYTTNSFKERESEKNLTVIKLFH